MTRRFGRLRACGGAAVLGVGLHDLAENEFLRRIWCESSNTRKPYRFGDLGA
jgi:hypothetical protein